MLPHPPADKQGWVALSELALDWGSKQEQRLQQEEDSDVSMAKVRAAASGQLAEYMLAYETQAEGSATAAGGVLHHHPLPTHPGWNQDGLEAVLDEDMDMSIALLAADAVAERVAAEARYEEYVKAKATHLMHPEAGGEATYLHQREELQQIQHVGTVGARDDVPAAIETTGTSDRVVAFATASIEPQLNVRSSNEYSSGFEDASGDSHYSSHYLSDESEDESEEDDEIRRLRHELASLKSRRRQRQIEAEAAAVTAADPRQSFGDGDGDSASAVAVAEPELQRQPQYQHPPSVGGWVVPKMKLTSGDNYGHDVRGNASYD
jgi:hypothetical protein